jgi:hypothetical protein
MVSVEIDSVSYDNLQRDLKQYGIKAKKAINDAVKYTALYVQKIAKQRLHGGEGSARHIQTARLVTSIHAEMSDFNSFQGTGASKEGDGKLSANPGELESIVGTNVDYAPAIEFGTKPHVIEPKNAKALHFKIGGVDIFAKKVNHPGFKGESFLRFAALKGKKYFEDTTTRELNKIVK